MIGLGLSIPEVAVRAVTAGGTPLILADFENGVYSVGGVATTLVAVVQEDTNNWGSTFNPGNVVPATGWVMMHNDGFALAGDALTTALAAVAGSGLRIVVNCSMDAAAAAIALSPTFLAIDVIKNDFSVAVTAFTQNDFSGVNDGSGHANNTAPPFAVGSNTLEAVVSSETLSMSINGSDPATLPTPLIAGAEWVSFYWASPYQVGPPEHVAGQIIIRSIALYAGGGGGGGDWDVDLDFVAASYTVNGATVAASAVVSDPSLIDGTGLNLTGGSIPGQTIIGDALTAMLTTSGTVFAEWDQGAALTITTILVANTTNDSSERYYLESYASGDVTLASDSGSANSVGTLVRPGVNRAAFSFDTTDGLALSMNGEAAATDPTGNSGSAVEVVIGQYKTTDTINASQGFTLRRLKARGTKTAAAELPALSAGGGGGGGYTGPLDIVSGAALAFGQRALSSAKRGTALYTIREDAGDTTQSFNSDATTGEAPVAAIASFLNGANGFVTSWNDQSANANNFGPDSGSEANQLQWSASEQGGKPGLLAVDSGGKQTTTSDVTFDGGATVFAVGKATQLSGPNDVFSFLFWVVSGLNFVIDLFKDPNEAAAVFTEPPQAADYHLWEAAWEFGSHSMRMDGAAVSQTTDNDAGGAVGSFATALSSFGGSPRSSVEMLIYPTKLSDADRLAVRQNIADYYGITLA